MKTKTLLGISLAAVFTVSMIAGVSASHPWLSVVDSPIDANGNNVKLTIEAADSIPRNAGPGVLAGFGWGYVSPNPSTHFAVTTHEPVRDSHQNPDGWHVHNVVLGATGASGLSGATGATGASACIESLTDYVESGIAVKDDTMNINTNQNTLEGDLAEGAVAFHINEYPSECGVTTLANGNPSGLRLGIEIVG